MKKILGTITIFLTLSVWILICNPLTAYAAKQDSEEFMMIQASADEVDDIRTMWQEDKQLVSSQTFELSSPLEFKQARTVEYTVKNFSEAYFAWDKAGNISAIVHISGQAFFYPDGKVHLYSFQCRVEIANPGNMLYEVVLYEIYNSDGSASKGQFVVEFRTVSGESACYSFEVLLVKGSTEIRTGMCSVEVTY